VRPQPGSNLAASIRARLLSLTQSKSGAHQRVLGRYAVERSLYSIGAVVTGINLPSKGRRCLPSGLGRLTVPQGTLVCWDKDPPILPTLNRKSLPSAEFRCMTVLGSTPNQSTSPELKVMMDTMGCASNSTRTWPKQGFRCKLTSVSATLFVPTFSSLPFRFFFLWKLLSFALTRAKHPSRRNFTPWSFSIFAIAAGRISTTSGSVGWR